jgi:arginase
MTFLVVPEWQGSSSSRALNIQTGAHALRQYLPRKRTRSIDVPLEAGDALGNGARRLSSIIKTHDLIGLALDEHDASGANEPLIVVGGDTASAIAPIQHAANTYGSDLRLLWFHASPCLEEPATSLRGDMNSMTLRVCLSAAIEDLAPGVALSPSQVALIGCRNGDAEDLEQPESVAAYTKKLPADASTPVFLAVDLSVLDPSEFAAVDTPVPFGMTMEQLVTAVRTAHRSMHVVGAAITGFAPASEAEADDWAGQLIELLGALSTPPPDRGRA